MGRKDILRQVLEILQIFNSMEVNAESHRKTYKSSFHIRILNEDMQDELSNQPIKHHSICICYVAR